MATDSTQSDNVMRFLRRAFVAALVLMCMALATACKSDATAAVDPEGRATPVPEGGEPVDEPSTEIAREVVEFEPEREATASPETTTAPTEIAPKRGEPAGSVGGPRFEFEVGSGQSIGEPGPDPEFAFESGAASSFDLIDYTDRRAVACPEEIRNEEIRCEYVAMPANQATPNNGDRVELMVAIVDNGDPLGIGPVVYLQGGPGAGAVDSADDYVGSKFDVILVDQRGTGFSEPSLDCPEFAGVYDSIVKLDSRSKRAEKMQHGAESRCRQRITGAGVTLSDYTSATNAADIALLRRVLGYDEWNVFGSSYGTRLALTLARDYPTGIRAMVLDAVMPPEVDFFGEIGENYLRAITALSEACAADVDCKANYGDLREAIDVAASQLDYEPAELTTVRPSSNETIDVVVDGPRFHGFIFDALYSTGRLGELPALIHQAATTGEVGELAAVGAADADPEGADFAEAMYWAVMCAEELPFANPDADVELARVADQNIVSAFTIGQFEGTCEQFDVPPAPAIEAEPVDPAMPVLAATGAFDPITPPRWGKALAANSSNVTFVEMSGRAHGAASGCFSSMMAAFFVDPTAPLDISCAAEADIDFG